MSRSSLTSSGLQFNGHDTGDGELILEHAAAKLGFEGVVSKTIDAPYAPGNRGLWRKAKALNRQEFVVVGWSDPEGSRPHLGALLLGYYADDGKLIYAGRVGTGMPVKVLADLRPPLGPAGPQNIAPERPAATLHPLRLAARPFPRPLGRAEARRGDHLSDLDGGQPPAAHGLRRAARGQAGRPGAAISSRRERTRPNDQRQSGIDVKGTLRIATVDVAVGRQADFPKPF